MVILRRFILKLRRRSCSFEIFWGIGETLEHSEYSLSYTPLDTFGGSSHIVVVLEMVPAAAIAAAATNVAAWLQFPIPALLSLLILANILLPLPTTANAADAVVTDEEEETLVDSGDAP